MKRAPPGARRAPGQVARPGEDSRGKPSRSGYAEVQRSDVPPADAADTAQLESALRRALPRRRPRS